MSKMPTPAPPRSGGMQFIEINNPKDGSWRKAVRSHAAHRRYAKTRQREVQNYQKKVERREEKYNQQQQQLVPHPETFLPIRSVDPFDSLARSTTRFESYLFSHYLNHVLPHANACSPGEDNRYIRDHWVQLASADVALLSAVFLSSSRSLTGLHASGTYSPVVLQYKGACIRSVNEAISKEGAFLSTSTIAAAVALASDSLVAEDFAAANQHCKAVEMMVQLMGGPSAFKAKDFLSRLVRWLLVNPPIVSKNWYLADGICKVVSGITDESSNIANNPAGAIHSIQLLRKKAIGSKQQRLNLLPFDI